MLYSFEFIINQKQGSLAPCNIKKMAETQFFTRKDNNLKEYKSNFKKALQKVKTVKIFELEVISFFEKWINSQKSYIPREDVDNFLENMNFLFKNKDFYDFILLELKKIRNNWNILEYSFNLISILNDSKKDFEKYLTKVQVEKKLKNNLEKSKKEDEEKLKSLENLFDEI